MSWFLTVFVFVAVAFYGLISAFTPIHFDFGIAVCYITIGFLTDVTIHWLQLSGGFR